MRALLALAVMSSLMGCAAANQAADTVARESAKTVINGIVAKRFPGMNVTPVTDCVIDNASRAEIFEIAKAGATGVTPATTQTVTGIIQRPGTVKCITQNGFSLFT